MIAMDEQLLEQINQYRLTAQSMGDAAREAMSRGDIGLARTAARQAAQHARIVVQLETGVKQTGPPERDRVDGFSSETFSE
jgi:phage shock protein A